jgi:hypothetical protein
MTARKKERKKERKRTANTAFDAQASGITAKKQEGKHRRERSVLDTQPGLRQTAFAGTPEPESWISAPDPTLSQNAAGGDEDAAKPPPFHRE